MSDPISDPVSLSSLVAALNTVRQLLVVADGVSDVTVSANYDLEVLGSRIRALVTISDPIEEEEDDA